MSMRKRLSCTFVSCFLASVVCAQDSPTLGTPVSDDELAEVDFTIMPDGSGLPDGSGNAVTGAEVYGQYCLACHGEGGTGGINDVLVGGHGSLITEQPVKTIGSYWPYATTLFDYIRRAMPYQLPGVLSDNEIYSLTAYLLYLNSILDEDVELTAETLPGVEMPNRENFVWVYSPGD